MAKSEPPRLDLTPGTARAHIAGPCRFWLAGQSILYTLKRSLRRGGITLSIDENGLRVGAPWRASQRRIESALAAHAHWIIRKLAEWQARKPAPFVWQTGAVIMLLGQPLTLAPGCGRPARPSATAPGAAARRPPLSAGVGSLSTANR